MRSEITFRGYIPELDGLRALAVILVLLVHFGPPADIGSGLWKLESVGWIGVDLFFVLSGFLITGILLDTREEQFFYRNFYIRRILRIFPLYYFVLLVGTLVFIGWHGAFDRDLYRRLYEIFWYFCYLGNFRIAFKNHEPSLAFLAPLWSLQIEEQFYLIFPFLVRKVRPVVLFRILVCVVVLSGPLRWVLYHQRPQSVLVLFMASPFRLDGLALGALVALRLRMGPWRIRLAHVVGLAVASFGALWAYSGWSDYPWSSGKTLTFGFSIIALAFTSLLLWVLYFRGTWQTSWLRGPLLYIGKISYGIYLLQAPAYVLVLTATSRLGRHLFVEEGWHTTSWWAFGLVCIVTVSFATVSWYFLERPILKLKNKYSIPNAPPPSLPTSS
jgi:peptidoglycan/LPS O-acetylase OafA/YrhL